MFVVTKTNQATRDLDDIWFYIAPDNMAAADGLLDEMERQCKQIARQPLMGRSRPELRPALRSFPVGRYVLFYQPTADGIELVRVLHSARDTGLDDFASAGNA